MTAGAALSRGPVVGIAVALLALGTGLVVAAARRRAAGTAGVGAAAATLGSLTLYAATGSVADAPAQWSSPSWLFASIFDSWPYVVVVGLAAGGLLALLATAVARGRPGRWTVAAIFAGALLAAAVVWGMAARG